MLSNPAELKIGDCLFLPGGLFYEIIKLPGQEDGPPAGQVDVGRISPNDPCCSQGRPIGLALTIDIVVWLDLLAVNQTSESNLVNLAKTVRP